MHCSKPVFQCIMFETKGNLLSKDPIIRSQDLDAAEVSWFAPICNDDFRHMGIFDDELKSTFEHASKAVIEAESYGFRNVLCPSSYQVGQDTVAFGAALAPMIQKIQLLLAIRCGEVHPPMLARAISTLDHILKGRLTINVISSDLPGETLESYARYRRSAEVLEILHQAFNQDEINFDGEFYKISLETTEPVKSYQKGGPLWYFGGYSPPAVDLCARYCDVYLMWPETQQRLKDLMIKMSDKASEYDRKLDFGLRVHVIVRETESEAREAARELMSRLDEAVGKNIRERAQDVSALGVARQTEMRGLSNDDGYAEPHLFTGIGRARSGCGAALVGSPEQILEKLQEYQNMGIRSFILSGYPNREECEIFGRLVMPHLKTCALAEVQNRVPKEEPDTPLAGGKRK